MKWLLQFTDWMLYTSVFAGFCAVALCMATESLFLNYPLPLISALHGFILGGTWLVYNAHFLLKKSHPEISDRFRWTQQNRKWHFIIFLMGFLIILFSLFFLSWKIILLAVFLAVLAFTYTLPILPFGKAQLRDFGWIKIITLSLVWTIVTVVLPIIHWEKSLLDFPFEILIRFVFLFALCVAFDIRDMQTDFANSIYTIPNLIGIKNSYRLINLSLLAFAGLTLLQYLRYDHLCRMVVGLCTALLTWLVVRFAKKYPSDKVYLGLVDGMMLFNGSLVAFFSNY